MTQYRYRRWLPPPPARPKRSLEQLLLCAILIAILGPFHLWIAGYLRRTRVWQVLQLSPVGDRLLLSSPEGTGIFETEGGKLLGRSRGRLRAAAFSRDGKRIAAVTTDGEILVLDGRTGTTIRTIATKEPGVVIVRFSPDGERVVGGGEGGEIQLWDADQGKLLWRKSLVTGRIFGLEFRDDDQIIAASYGSKMRIYEIRFVRARDGVTIAAHPRTNREPTSFTVSARGDVAAVGTAYAIEVFDVATWKLVGGTGLAGESLALSRDGSRLAVGGRSWLTRHDLGTNAWSGVGSVRHKAPVGSVVIRPDGLAVSAAHDGAVWVSNFDTLEARRVAAGLRLSNGPVPWHILAGFGLWLFLWMRADRRTRRHQGEPAEGPESPAEPSVKLVAGVSILFVGLGLTLALRSIERSPTGVTLQLNCLLVLAGALAALFTALRALQALFGLGKYRRLEAFLALMLAFVAFAYSIGST